LPCPLRIRRYCDWGLRPDDAPARHHQSSVLCGREPGASAEGGTHRGKRSVLHPRPANEVEQRAAEQVRQSAGHGFHREGDGAKRDSASSDEDAKAAGADDAAGGPEGRHGAADVSPHHAICPAGFDTEEADPTGASGGDEAATGPDGPRPAVSA